MIFNTQKWRFPVKRLIFFSLFGALLLFTNTAYAQKEANFWYFGYNAGLSFATGSPVLLTNGQLNTDEGVASISDASGALLFYTDGITIWDKRHLVMPNGNGLLGHNSSSQSAIVIPKPGDAQRYLVFTVDELGNANGLCYSVVNMQLNGGNGDVELRNVPLQTPVTEKITAVKHCNGTDIWVIVHGWNSDAFYSYLVTPAGVNPVPVTTHTGRMVGGQVLSAIGYLKASPNGKKLAIAHNLIGADLLDFDNTTGIVSNPISLFLPAENYTHPYGVEFSPNSSLLYTSVYYLDPIFLQLRNSVLQYDVSLGSAAAIIASKQVLYTDNYIYQTGGALQMGPDGKMYVTLMTQPPTLAAINQPDVYGPGCNFVYNQVQFGLQIPRFGLPTFLQSLFLPSFTFSESCMGLNIQFNYTRPSNVTAVKWDFGDPASGAANQAVTDNPLHIFSSPGQYTVKLVRYTVCGNDTVSKVIQAGQLSVNLGNDTSFCGVAQYTLTPGTPGTNNYLWSTGATTASITANQNGLYWVEVSNPVTGCVKRDSIQLRFGQYPVFSLGNDTTICTADTVWLSANVSNATYLWNNGNTTNRLPVTATGLYWLEVTSNGCTKRDSLFVQVKPAPVVQLGRDTLLCDQQTLLLNAANTGATYQWQNGATSPTFLVNTAGRYSVTADINGCKARDTIDITYQFSPHFSLGPNLLICPNMQFSLTPDHVDGNLLWQDGSTGNRFIVRQEGVYYLQQQNFCGSLTDTVTVSRGLCKLLVPTVFTPNGDGVNDVFAGRFGEDINNYRLQVYNRWGQKVFETTTLSKGWDGTMNGKLQPAGAFAYLITYTTLNNSSPAVLKGTVLLIR